MKKDELALVFMTVLLCAAAFAAASGALTDPFRSGGAVEAFFEDKKPVSIEVRSGQFVLILPTHTQVRRN